MPGGNELPKDSTNENPDRFGVRARGPTGRLLALDLGEKRVGVAVSDERQLTVRPLPYLRRTNWKQLLAAVADLLQRFDAQALVIGLPLNLDGNGGEAAGNVRRLARNFSLSLRVPVFLQDERLTSREAEESLRAEGLRDEGLRERVDSEAAAIILRDYLTRPGEE
jgi:putative holliday junction resolvase